MTARVLAHLAGPSGSGKTRLLHDLVRRAPEVVPLELDSVDDAACRQLGWARDWRAASFGHERFRYFQSVRQRIFNECVAQYVGAPIVVAGFHVEANVAYEFAALHRIRLAVPPLLAAFRGFRRDHRMLPCSVSELDQRRVLAIWTERQLERAGYTVMTHATALALLEDCAKRPAELV